MIVVTCSKCGRKGKLNRDMFPVTKKTIAGQLTGRLCLDCVYPEDNLQMLHFGDFREFFNPEIR
jgi:hypothetical protein